MADPNGYYKKFVVYRANDDGTPGEEVIERTFTLLLDSDPLAAETMLAYADQLPFRHPLAEWIYDEFTPPCGGYDDEGDL